MKYDIRKKTTRGALRVLNAFTKAMFQLTARQKFEDVTVNELCEKANYPRSTFYNYFEDKYDLLEYCWTVLFEKLRLEEASQFEEDHVLIIYFDRLYDLMNEQDDAVSRILQHNPLNSYMYMSFREHIKKSSHEIFERVFIPHDSVPAELTVEHCCSTVMIVIEWIFIKRNLISKALAHQYLSVIFGNPDLANKTMSS